MPQFKRTLETSLPHISATIKATRFQPVSADKISGFAGAGAGFPPTKTGRLFDKLWLSGFVAYKL